MNKIVIIFRLFDYVATNLKELIIFCNLQVFSEFGEFKINLQKATKLLNIKNSLKMNFFQRCYLQWHPNISNISEKTNKM